MIQNEREYSHAKAQIRRLEAGLEEARKSKDRLHVDTYAAMIAGLESQIAEMREEVDAYTVFAGASGLHLPSAQNLGQLLIFARKARGWSQKELGERSGLGELIQRYEKEEYARTKLDRVLRVMKALDLDLEAHITLTPYSKEPRLACLDALDRAARSALDAGRPDYAREIIALGDEAKSGKERNRLSRRGTDLDEPEERGEARVQPTTLYVCSEALDRAAASAYYSGQYELVVKIAGIAHRTAVTGDQRLRACNREIGGHDGLGQFSGMIDAAMKGLAEENAKPSRRRLVRANLATARYAIDDLSQALVESNRLVRAYERTEPEENADRIARAQAYYVRGHTFRELGRRSRDDESRQHAIAAHADLLKAIELHEDLAANAKSPAGEQSYRAIANTCAGGLLQIDVLTGAKTDVEALEAIHAAVSNPRQDVEQHGDWRESYAWWCAFGIDIAMNASEETDEVRSYVTAWLAMIGDIARDIDDWRLWERLLSLEYQRRLQAGASDDPWPDELTARVPGLLDRFPQFAATGSAILGEAA